MSYRSATEKLARQKILAGLDRAEKANQKAAEKLAEQLINSIIAPQHYVGMNYSIQALDTKVEDGKLCVTVQLTALVEHIKVTIKDGKALVE